MARTNLDITYERQRRLMINKIEDAAVSLWTGRKWGDDEGFINRVVPFVQGGMMQTVHLLNAYFTQKARVAVGRQLPVHTVPVSEITISKLRGVPAEEVYRRAFAVLGMNLADGKEFKTADIETGDYVRKLVATDMQLAQTHAARAWMVSYG